MSDRPQSTPTSFPERDAAISGKALRLLRDYRRLTQAELSRLSGIAKSTISDFERGRRAPRLDILERLLQSLDLHLGAFDAARGLLERLQRPPHVIYAEELALRTGHYAESLVRAVLRSSRPALEGRP